MSLSSLFRFSILLIGVTAGALPALAQQTPIAGLMLGVTEAEALPAINEACSGLQRHEVSDTRFPFAEASEVHWRCEGLVLSSGATVEHAVFTFADDQLILIEGRGNADALAPDADPVTQVAGYEVYMPDQILLNRTTGQGWVVASPTMAALAVSWDNPVWGAAADAQSAFTFSLPERSLFGESVATVETQLVGRCDVMQLRDIEDIWLATASARQQQLECFGIEVGGYPRKVEFIFGDGILEQMWVLMGPADIARLREVFTADFGDPDDVDEVYEAFDGWRIAIRKDNPEVLLGSDRLAEIWRREHP